MTSSHRLLARTLSGLATALALTSCSFFSNEPIKLRTQEEVGSVQVAVQSVAPFEDYISSLEPQFELKAQDAFAQAIAQTQTQDTQLVNQFMATLQIALPQITRAKTSTETNDGSATTTTSTIDRSSLPGTIATPSTAPGVSTPTVTATLPPGTVDIDPALRYRAAAALAQEVSLLNRYVRDAAVSTGTKPYIVRLLVTVMPGSRNQPYDAYSTISFFTAKDQKAEKSWVYEKLRDVKDLKQLDAKIATCDTSEVRVIPLLVTDNLESSLHTNALQRIRDIALALNGTLNNIGLGLGTRSHNEEIDKTLGKNLNSIFALGQPAPNAVVARLGAAFSNGKFVTVGRTYGVSVLVLAKTMDAYKGDFDSVLGSEVIPCPSIKFVATTQMHDAHGRTFLPLRPPTMARQSLITMLASRNIRQTPDQAGTLLSHAAAADFESFKTALQGQGDVAGAWTDALSVASGSGRSVGEFSVSIPRTTLPDAKSRFSVFDDGKVMTLTINNGTNLQADRLSAVVKAQWPDRWVYLTNDDVKVKGYGTSATFTFPSLSKIRAANPDLKVDMCHLYAMVTYSRGARIWQAGNKSVEMQWFPADPLPGGTPVDRHVKRARLEGVIDQAELPIEYVVTKAPEDPPPPKPGFTTSSPSVVLADATGAGNVVLEIRKTDPANIPVSEVRFRVLSGGFISAPVANTTKEGTDYVATEGTYVLAMKNLRPRIPVVIRAFRMDGKKEIAVSDLPIEVAED